MSSIVPDNRPLSIDEYADLPDDGWRTELVRGRVVREPQPAFEHGRVQVVVAGILQRYVSEHEPDMVCVGTIGVITEEERHTVRGPDLAVVRKGRVKELHRSGFLRGGPDLAVEIVSPSNRAGDIQEKVAEYLAAGSRLVWVIYPQTRTVAVHPSPGEARFLGEEESLTGGEVLPELDVPVTELFGE